VGNVKGEAQTLDDLGKAYEKLGQPAKARQCYEKAREIKSKIERVKVKDRP
jgi:Flp pilus assembly protein TadD